MSKPDEALTDRRRSSCRLHLCRSLQLGEGLRHEELGDDMTACVG